MEIKRVEIEYEPRYWAEGFHASLKRFASLILHRRAGKTTAIVNHHIRAAMDDAWEEQRLRTLMPSITDSETRELIKPPGGRHYGHVMPTRVQAKMVAWDKLKFYAAPLKPRINEAELLLRFSNGNKVQLFGADDPDAMRGPAFSGLSFDEFSQQPSNIFSTVLSKALGEHLGYAIFAGTIKGKDHLYDTYRAAQQDSTRWFSLWQDVDQSLKSETSITVRLLEEAMRDDRNLIAQGLMTQEEFDQEWYLSLEAAIKGAYYAPQLAQARRDGRIRPVPYDPDWPVNTAWDLGHTDDSAIWFYQNVGREIHVIDYYAESGGTIEQFSEGEFRPGSLIKALFDRPYRYGRHWLPHDARAKTLASDGKSIVEKMAKYAGIGNLTIVPGLSIQDGITAARSALGRCWFDAMRCEKGLNALLHYRRKYDNRTDAFAKIPMHDWSSHGSDAFRMLAIAERQHAPEEPLAPAGKTIQTITLDELWQWHEERLAQDRKI